MKFGLKYGFIAMIALMMTYCGSEKKKSGQLSPSLDSDLKRNQSPFSQPEKIEDFERQDDDPKEEEDPSDPDPDEDPSDPDPDEDPIPDDPVPDQEDPEEEDEIVGPESKIQFETYPAQRTSSSAPGNTLLYDISVHIKSKHGNTYYDADRVTWAHETSHGIHSDLRFEFRQGHRINGFYVGQDRAVVIKEPGNRKRHAAEFIPSPLRGPRYNLYVVGQTAWDDTPSYLLDEWNAYINGGEAGVELHEKGLWTNGWRDAVMGLIEFQVYAIAMLAAVEKNDPTYFQSEYGDQLKAFIAWNMIRGQKVFLKGAKIKDFKYAKQESYYQTLLEDSSATSIREKVDAYFGYGWFAKYFLPIED